MNLTNSLGKKLFLSALLTLTCVWLAWANSLTNGQLKYQISYDLNGDGRQEVTALKVFGATSDQALMQLVVFNSQGKVIYAGPKITKPEDPEVFGSWNWGISDLQFIGDIDGDGHLELVGAMPQSDVRPTLFRIWRWNGKAYKLLGKKQLLEGQQQGTFEWVKPQLEYDKICWIVSFKRQGGSISGDVFDATSSPYKSRHCQFRLTKNGLVAI